MDNNGYSLADIASVANGNDGMFGNGGMWIFALLILVLIGGGGLFGNRNGMNMGDFAQFATSASQSEILLGQQFQNLDNKLDRLGNGIADSTYALNNAITNEGRNIQTQLCAINSNIDNKFAMLEKNQMQAQIDAQAREINQLYIAQQMCNVVRWPNGMAYTASGSPFCNYNGGGCGCSCN